MQYPKRGQQWHKSHVRLAMAVGTRDLAPPRTDPYGPNSGIRLPPRVCNDATLYFFPTRRMRFSACDTVPRRCVRPVLC